MRRHEEKDAELDRRIVALRKKNQALLRRYQVSVLYRLRGLLWLVSLATFKRLFTEWVLSEGLSPFPVRVLGTGDAVPLPPGVPLVFLCVGLSASVCL